jgi:hypothetical protein
MTGLAAEITEGEVPRPSATRGTLSLASGETRQSLIPVELLFLAVTLVACFAGAAKGVQLLFTPLSLAVGIYLFRNFQSRYVSFALWLWFLSPFVRRVADFHAGWVDPSPVLLAPLLVSALSATTLVRRGYLLFRREYLPFSMAGLAVTYGLALGLVQCPLQAVITDFLKWMVPPLFALHCLALKDESDALLSSIARTFTYGVGGMGIYGIWQYFSPPPWDIYWLLNADGDSFGSAARESVRVFSTMNSPGPFGITIAAGALLLSCVRGKLARVAQVAGLAALLMSEVRSAWIGAVVGFGYMLVKADNKLRINLLSVTVITIAVIASAVAITPDAFEKLSKRADSFSDLTQDESYNERSDGNQRMLVRAVKNPYGRGMGYLDSSYGPEEGSGGNGMGKHDSGLYEFLITIGFLGCLLYGIAVTLVMAQSVRRASVDNGMIGYAAACVSILVQLPLGNPLLGVNGFVFWLSAAMILKKTGLAEASRCHGDLNR